MTPHCANCAALRAQIVNLERQMGRSFPKGAMGAVSDAFGLSWPQARLLLTIYYRGDWTPSDYISKHLEMDDAVRRTTIYRMRQRMGSDRIESRYGAGYRLNDVGRQMIDAALKA